MSMETYVGYIKGIYDETARIGGWSARVHTMKSAKKELSKTAKTTKTGVDYYSGAVRMELTAAINVVLESPENSDVYIVTSDPICESLLLNKTQKEEYQDLVDRFFGICYCRKRQKVYIKLNDPNDATLRKAEVEAYETVNGLVKDMVKDTPKDRHTCVIFTKGCCNDESQFPRKGGWAFAMYDGKSAVKADNPLNEGSGAVSGESTDNRMELRAIVEAVKTLPKGSKVWILTDSKYSIQVLDHRKKEFNYNTDYIKSFYDMVIKNRIAYDFKWIKEGSGNVFHEKVSTMVQEEMRKDADGDTIDLTQFVSNEDLQPDIKTTTKTRSKKKMKVS